jgi:hypothetical protein
VLATLTISAVTVIIIGVSLWMARSNRIAKAVA